MRLHDLRELIDTKLAAGTVDGDGVLLGLFRNLGAPIDSDEGWTEMAVVDIELDLESDDLDLATTSSEPRPPLTLVELSSRLVELQPEYDELRVRVEGEHREVGDWGMFAHWAVVGSGVQSDTRRLAVIAEYEGYDSEF